MKNNLIILLLLFFIILSGCKVEEVLSPDDIYVEYTVVQAEIHPGEDFPAVRFTKTLPLGVTYDIKKAELTDVTAYIRKNEVQVIPLLYDADGNYKPKYRFIVREGETLELFAETYGKFIYAKTIIPFIPEISSPKYNLNEFYLDAKLTTKENEVYGALWIIPGSPPVKADDFFSISGTTIDPNTQITVQSSPLPEKYRTPLYDDNRYIQVFAFDKSFRDYFYSKPLGQQIENPYIQQGGAVEWNVQGDKVIGMFIGIAPGEIVKVN